MGTGYFVITTRGEEMELNPFTLKLDPNTLKIAHARLLLYALEVYELAQKVKKEAQERGQELVEDADEVNIALTSAEFGCGVAQKNHKLYPKITREQYLSELMKDGCFAKTDDACAYYHLTDAAIEFAKALKQKVESEPTIWGKYGRHSESPNIYNNMESLAA